MALCPLKSRCCSPRDLEPIVRLRTADNEARIGQLGGNLFQGQRAILRLVFPNLGDLDFTRKASKNPTLKRVLKTKVIRKSYMFTPAHLLVRGNEQYKTEQTHGAGV